MHFFGIGKYDHLMPSNLQFGAQRKMGFVASKKDHELDTLISSLKFKERKYPHEHNPMPNKRMPSFLMAWRRTTEKYCNINWPGLTRIVFVT